MEYYSHVFLQIKSLFKPLVKWLFLKTQHSSCWASETLWTKWLIKIHDGWMYYNITFAHVWKCWMLWDIMTLLCVENYKFSSQKSASFLNALRICLFSGGKHISISTDLLCELETKAKYSTGSWHRVFSTIWRSVTGGKWCGRFIWGLARIWHRKMRRFGETAFGVPLS